MFVGDWMEAERLEVENCLVDGCLALKTVDCSDGEKDIVKRGA